MTEQSTHDGAVERRKTFDATGATLNETVVIAGTPLFDAPGPVTAQLDHPSGAITLYDPQNPTITIGTQPSGTRVTLRKAEQSGFVITLDDGTDYFCDG